MNKKDYLRNKGLLPKSEYGNIWIVHSSDKGVTLTEHLIWDINEVTRKYQYVVSTRSDGTPYLNELFISLATKSTLNYNENTHIPDYWESLGYQPPGDSYTPNAVYGFLVKEDAEKKFAEEQKWMDKYFHPTNYIEQSVRNNSVAFHEFLKEKNIDYKPNGHLTTIIGNHDKFELGVAFGKKWAEWEASQK